MDPDAQDARVEALWATLDTSNQGQLDLSALKKGLRKLDHRTFDLLRPKFQALTDCDSSQKCG